MTDADAPQRDEGADLLARYRSEIRFESELLSNRLNSFMSSQSFLLIAYASAMSAAHGRWQHPFTLALPPALAVLGLVLALYARPGIRAAYAEIRLWQEQERELLAREPRCLSTYLGPSIPAGSATTSPGSQAGAEMDVQFPAWLELRPWRRDASYSPGPTSRSCRSCSTAPETPRGCSAGQTQACRVLTSQPPPLWPHGRWRVTSTAAPRRH